MVRKLTLIGGVVVIVDHHGSSLTLILMYESDTSARKAIELIQRITNAETFVRVNIPFPRCAIQLTKSDWRIIKAIQASPRRSFLEVSKDVNMSAKTVRRRLQRMIDGKALFAAPSVDPKALRDATIADLLVFYASPDFKSEVDRKIVTQFGEVLMRAEVGDPGHGFFNFIIGNIPKAKEILTWVKAQPGVANASIELVQDRIEVYESFTEQIDKKLSEVSISR